MGYEELIKAAFTGPNAIVFGFLNVIVAVAQHLAIISNRLAFGIAALVGGLVGAFGGFIETQATVGVAPEVLVNAALVGGIVGAGSSTLVGLAVVKTLAAANVLPVSDAKKLAEEIRDPMSPTQPK